MVSRSNPTRASAIIALAALSLLAGCQKPPRGISYFDAHREEAKIVAAQCRAGTNTTDECAAAEQVARIDEHKAELERELGTSKRKPASDMHF